MALVKFLLISRALSMAMDRYCTHEPGQMRMEKFQRVQHQQNRDALQAKLDRMQIVSSVSGGVEEI